VSPSLGAAMSKRPDKPWRMTAASFAVDTSRFYRLPARGSWQATLLHCARQRAPAAPAIVWLACQSVLSTILPSAITRLGLTERRRAASHLGRRAVVVDAAPGWAVCLVVCLVTCSVRTRSLSGGAGLAGQNRVSARELSGFLCGHRWRARRLFPFRNQNPTDVVCLCAGRGALRRACRASPAATNCAYVLRPHRCAVCAKRRILSVEHPRPLSVRLHGANDHGHRSA
jgi:hypothetical protein